MTLIAGFLCSDGFVIAADTEIQYGAVNFQNSKLRRTFSDKYGYTLTIGGAGDVSYFTMAAQKIRDEVATLVDPTMASIKNAIDTTISKVHNGYIFKHWHVDAGDRPRFNLIVGVHDGKGGCMVLRSDDVALIEVQSYDFIGSGSSVAHLTAERVIIPGLSTAVTLHLAVQIFREVKGKGVAVGGNTEIYAYRKNKDAEQFFDLPLKDYRFLWGLEEAVLGGMRDALIKERNDPNAIPECMKYIEETLRKIRVEIDKSRTGAADEQNFIEFGSEYGNPWKR